MTFQVERARPASGRGEKESLAEFLDFHRATLPIKLGGVSDADLRRPLVPSGTSLLALVKHLAYVEWWWFDKVFSGNREWPWPDHAADAGFRIDEHETTERILGIYEEACARSRAVTADASLDDTSKDPKRPRTLRWIMLHMIEETARHNGHADILREMIDGTIGE